MGSARSHKSAARLRSVGRRFELVARILAGYAVVMEVARRPEGPEVNGDVLKKDRFTSFARSIAGTQVKGLYPSNFNFLIYLSPLPFFAAFSKSADMKATLAHSYMYQ